MRVMSMSGLEPDFGEGEGGLFKELRAQRIKLNESLKKKTELSFDEEKVGKGVAEYFAAQLPAGKKLDKAKHPTEFAAVNAAFGDDDPRRELMPVVKENYKTLLRNKEYAGADEKQLLDLAYQVTVKGTPSQELEGATLEDDIHRYKYKSDTALFGGGNVAAAPGYDAWLEKEKARPMEDRQIGFGTGIAANLAFGLGARALKKPVANFIGKSLLKAGVEGLGQTLTKVGPPQGKLVGAALMLAATAIPETMAYNAIAKTDWYRAREDEPVKRELAGLAATIVGGTAAYKVGAKTGASILKKAAEKELVSQSALNVFLKDQDAKAIIAIGKARREEKAARDVLSKTLETVPSDVERKAWFEALGKSEEQLFGKTTDEEFLKGKFRRANRNLQRQLLLKSPVEGQPFGWAGEANGPTRYGRVPGYTSRTISSFDDLSAPAWDGTGGGAARVNSNLGEPWFDQQMGTPLQTRGANFEGYPFGQARNTGEQLALPPGSQLGLPTGGPGQPALPPSGVFGPRGFWTDVRPTEPPSGGAGGGGIFGLSPEGSKIVLTPGLAFKKVVGKTPEGKLIFGINKKAQQKVFESLTEDEAVLVTDQVLNGGKSLSDALEGMSQSRAIRKALEATEAKVTVAQKKTTVLPPDNVIGYEGAEAAAEAGKAAKVMVLKQEIAEAAPELAARKTAEAQAVKSTANVIKETSTLVDDVVRGVAPASKESVELTDDVIAEGLRYLGSKSRNIAPHQLDQEVARLRATKVKHPEFYKEADEFGSDVVAGPRRVRSEQAVLDPTRQTSDFEILSKLGSRRTAKDVDDYITKLTEYDAQTGGYFYRNLEAERLYNYLTKQGVPVDKIDSHPISVEFRKLVAQANERIDEVVAPVTDDLAEFGGMSVNRFAPAVENAVGKADDVVPLVETKFDRTFEELRNTPLPAATAATEVAAPTVKELSPARQELKKIIAALQQASKAQQEVTIAPIEGGVKVKKRLSKFATKHNAEAVADLEQMLDKGAAPKEVARAVNAIDNEVNTAAVTSWLESMGNDFTALKEARRAIGITNPEIAARLDAALIKTGKYGIGRKQAIRNYMTSVANSPGFGIALIERGDVDVYKRVIKELVPPDSNAAMLRSIIPAAAVGTVSVAAVLGLPEDSHASVASVIGEAAARGIKALPKAWFSTITESKKLAAMGKDETKKVLANFVKEADEAGFTARTVGTSKVLPRRMITPNFAELAKEIYGSTVGAVKTVKALPFGAENLMGPWGRGALHYGTGANPAVHLAAMQTTWTNNIDNAYAVLQNIMKDVKGGKSAANEVAKIFEPLAEEYSGVVSTYGIVQTKLKQINKALPALEKALKDPKLDDAAKASLQKKWNFKQRELETFTTALREKVGPQYDEFIAKHEALTKDAAQKYPSTRIFLAANDTGDHQYYPWLKELLTSEERIAADHVKAMMKTYEESAVASGLNVITDRPYMHYAWHPKWQEAKAADYAKSIGLDLPITTVPYNQFHSRLVGAQPMVPDVYHSVQSYVPMAEKILGWRSFWNKQGPKDASWYKHMMSSTVQQNPALRSMWNAIKDASLPTEQMMVDKWMDRYTSFEVLRLLGGSPSVAYKHFFKNIGTWGSLGFKEAASHMGTAVTTAARNKLLAPESMKYLEKLGINTSKISKKFYDDAARSYTNQAKRISILDDLELTAPSQLGWFDNMLQQVNHKAGFMVNAVESYDRVHSFLAAGEMAAKRGLTARDASYAIYDTILKNNFLGGVLNPSWAKSPLVRATMLFQTTAFKIFERRMVNAVQSGRAVKEVFKSVKGQEWTWDKIMAETKTLKDFITRGEYEFKKGIITDALASERDFLGQFSVRQSMREMLYAGIVLGGGAAMGHDYAHHISHLPFLGKSQDGEPIVGLSPIARALWDTKEGKVYGGEESEWGVVGDFLNNWFRSQGPIPQMVSKSIKVSQDDIPEIYREEGFLPKEFRYFWAIPSPKEKE